MEQAGTQGIGKAWYHVIAIVIVAIWGTTLVSTKTLINCGMTPLSIYICRIIIAYSCLLAVCHNRLWADSVRDELLMCLSGITGGSLYFLSENTALELTYASDVSLLVCTAPIFTLFLNKMAFGADLRKRAIVGAVIALCGVGFVVFNGAFRFGGNPLGDLLTIVAALSWAVYCILIKWLGQKYSTQFITRKMFGYGLLTASLTLFVKPVEVSVSTFSIPTVWGNLLFLSLIASTLCFLMWNKTVEEIGADKASNYIYITPLMTIVTASIFLDERLSLFTALGTLLILGGVWIAERSKS